jgi:hypothetical protein
MSVVMRCLASYLQQRATTSPPCDMSDEASVAANLCQHHARRPLRVLLAEKLRVATDGASNGVVQQGPAAARVV